MSLFDPAMRRHGSTIFGADSLLEREVEVARFGDLLERASAGNGQLLVVEGPAGIGKTRLLDAGRAAAADHGLVVLGARASELDREFPFGVIRQLFEPVLVESEEPERARLLSGSARLAAPLLGGAPAETPSRGAPDQSLMLFHALYWMTANLSHRGPVLMTVDDAHWADVISMQCMQFLLARLQDLPVLVAIGRRIGEPSSVTEVLDALAADSLSQVVRLAPLSRDAVAMVVTDALGAGADRAFCDACHEATGGNPFLLRELLRELAADGVAPTAANGLLVRQLGPSTVARAVLIRLARLGEGASKLARAVAVLGDRVPVARSCALAGLDEDQGHELAHILTQAGIFAPARPLSFAHPILRAAVYGEFDPGERALAHRRASELLMAEGADVDAVAVHLLATEPRGDPRVVETLRAAAASALSRGATQTAVLALRRALEEPPPVEERARSMLELASAELSAGDSARASEQFEEVARTTSDPRLRATFAWDHALALQALGRHEEAFRIRERAVDDVREIDPDLAFSLEASLIASARLALSRLEWATRRLDRYLAEPSVPEQAAQRMRVTGAQISAFARESSESADALADVAQRALASGHLINGTIGLTTPFFSAVELLSLADRPRAGRQALDNLVEQGQRRGSAPVFAFACGWRCLLLTREGLLAEAEADARSCAELALSQGWFRLSPLILGYILDALIERAELSEARRVLEASGMGSETAGDSVLFDPVIHARARLRALSGDLAGARRDLAGLARRDARWNTYPSLVPPVLIAPELVGGDLEQSRADAEAMLREARVWDTARAVGMALRAKALLCEGAERIELLRHAAGTLEGSPARVDHARTLVDLGAALRAGNHRAGAREPLRQALDIADAAGATLVAGRASRELRAAGGRPRRPRTAGPQSLTASERRIAVMAAEGRSNPEIAQALFITKKTVEAHLASAYRKLDIHSRKQLEFALGQDSAPA